MSIPNPPELDEANLDADERGASLVEYALLLALIAIVCIGALTFLGGELNSSYDHSNSTIFP